MKSVRALLLACIASSLALGACKSGGNNTGTGGMGAPAGCPPADHEDLISDFYSDNSIFAVDGRQGGWYTYGDANGSFATSSGYKVDLDMGNPNCSSDLGSLYVKATGFSDWGAAMGVDFRPRPTNADGSYGAKMTYDASKYKGVAFWAKAGAPLDGVQVSFPDLYTDATSPPHEMTDPFDSFNHCTDCNCVYTTGSWLNCSPYLVQFGKKGDAAASVAFQKYMDVQIDTTWKRFEILFADTRQDPGNLGYHPADDKLTVSALTAMAIQVNANYDTTPKSARDFEIWLDDVYFIK
jgi:hypothetical protein